MTKYIIGEIFSSDGATLYKNPSDQTVLSLLAHRLSTITHADLILVLKEGEIVQRGKHEELLDDEDGLYQELWNQQSNVKNIENNSNTEEEGNTEQTKS